MEAVEGRVVEIVRRAGEQSGSGRVGLAAGADTCLLAPKLLLTDCSSNTDCFHTNLVGTLCQRKHTNKQTNDTRFLGLGCKCKWSEMW